MVKAELPKVHEIQGKHTQLLYHLDKHFKKIFKIIHPF